MQKPQLKTQKAFTLIELLIVISIIGILVGIISISFTTAQKQGRDSRRKGDMKDTQTALEQYYAENSIYPTGGDIDNAFQGNRPQDPGSNSYNWTSTADSYCICATLETSKGNASDTSCTWNNSGDYFCVKNQQ